MSDCELRSGWRVKSEIRNPKSEIRNQVPQRVVAPLRVRAADAVELAEVFDLDDDVVQESTSPTACRASSITD